MYVQGEARQMHFSLAVHSGDVGVLGSMGPAPLCMGGTLMAMLTWEMGEPKEML